ncbi:MAG: hypothetical protein GVY15_08160 [Bacteroidetes bacterium]|nr:hypothetical protein [Bacteroidota bacterium]
MSAQQVATWFTETAALRAGGCIGARLAVEQSGPTACIIGGFTATPKWPDADTLILPMRRGPDNRWRITADVDNRHR